MKKCIIVITSVFFNFLYFNMLFASADTWTQKTDFGGAARYSSVGFSIGSMGYLGTGFYNNGNYRDFWEYDPTSDTWTQKANFGGTARYFAVGFSIGSKGYVGTGWDSSDKKDFWVYDPVANTWTQKTDFGGTARSGAVGFSVGSKGYIGTGVDGSYYKDFWEYDPTSDTWAQKADFGGTARYDAVGFSIGSKGYVGTGNDGYLSFTKDFWEYDPVADTWTQKTDFGGTARSGAVGFSVGNKGYIGTGSYVISETGYSTKDFWEYNPAVNTWTQKADLGGAAKSTAVGFSIGSKGYVGTGSSTKDFWEYDSSSFFFTDVPPTYWAYAYIMAIYNAGYTTGYGGTDEFKPEYNVTREQMAAFIIRAADGEPAANYCSTGSPFPDCSTDSWSCKYIKRLFDLGLTTGYGTSGLYMPSLNVTRAQMAAFITRAVEGEPAVNYCASGSPFTDVTAADWSCVYIKRLYELGITTGYGDGRYGPLDLVTRAQMAVFLGRAFLALKTEASATIGTLGGAIEVINPTSPLNGIKVEIAEGALTSPTVIWISGALNGIGSPASFHQQIGTPLEIQPNGLRFEKPIQISIPYADEDNDGIIDGTEFSEKSLSVWCYTNEGLWEHLAILEQNFDQNVLVVRASHLSSFSIYSNSGPHVSYHGQNSLMFSGDCANVGGYSDYIVRQVAGVGVDAFFEFGLHLWKPYNWLFVFLTDITGYVGNPTSSSVIVKSRTNDEAEKEIHVTANEEFMIKMGIMPGDNHSEWEDGIYLTIDRNTAPQIEGPYEYYDSYLIANSTEAPHINDKCLGSIYYKTPINISRPGKYRLSGPYTTWTGKSDPAYVYVHETSGPPQLISSIPFNGQTNVPVSQRSMSYTFNEPMRHPSNYSVTWSGFPSYMMAPEGIWSADAKTIVFAVSSNWPPNTYIGWVLNPSTHTLNFKDLDGNPLPADVYHGGFTTGSN